ncbi:MAG: BTAD domain-containing putative transcriptional regulator [Ilumatobacteraceae bacterium]
MDIAVLGPLVVGDGRLVLGSRQERAIVELLALTVPHGASVDALVGAVWGERPPPSATKTLQGLVSRARSAVPGLVIDRVGEAYRLAVDRVDAQEFEHLVVEGRRASEDGDAEDALEALNAARRLWRGAPAPDLADGPARSACTRLEELFRTLVEDLNAARLVVGGDAALIADLEAACSDEPLRQQRWAQLMLALHRDGRQAEALRTFQRARTILGEQLGLEPDEELRDLERAIVTDDSSLVVGRRSWGSGRRRASRPGQRARRRLPPTLTSFVGRVDEGRLVAKRLDEAPLVTITGPGGVGKTRLAIEVADRIEEGVADGVWFVDLTPATGGRSLASAIAESIGVRELPGTGLETTIVDRCATLRGVVVLDNCEHVIADVAALSHRLLLSARSLRVLATSREPLGVTGELIVPLTPLATPLHGERRAERIAEIDAVRLFTDRAAAVDPGFAINHRNALAVASLCRRLDGLPLALELAAAQVPALGPAQIDARLADRGVLQSHERTGLDRHRSMRTLLDWSATRLAPAERTIFHRLSVFPASMSLEAIEAVVTDERIALADVLPALIHLVRCSLVVAEGTGPERRYRLLETVRQYGRDRLAADGDLERCRDRHCDWVLPWAVEAAKGLRGDDQASSLDLIEQEFDNVEAALEWSAADPDRAALAIAPIVALHDFWLARGTRRAQGVHWTLAMSEAAISVAPAVRVRAMAKANVMIGQSDLAAAARIADAAQRLAASAPRDQRAALYATLARCWTDIATGVPPSYAPLTADEMQAPDDPDRRWIDSTISSCLASAGDLVGARLYMRRVLADPGLDRHTRGSLLAQAVDLEATIGGDLDRLRGDARESLEVATEMTCSSCTAQSLASLLLVDDCDDLGGPVAVARHSLRLADGIHETMGVIRALDMIVGALAAEGHEAEAVRVAGASSTLRRRTGYAEPEPGRRAFRQAGLERARARIPPDEFTAHWTAGSRLDYPRLISELLGPVE